ncbi:chorismate lyase/3-hydroxybenzoate synthase [Rhodococcus sp. 27YEA15]
MSSDGFDSFTETWITNRSVTCGTSGDLAYSYDGEYFFCVARIPEAGEYANATRSVYEQAFRLIAEYNYQNIFRMWNFVGGIVEKNSQGMEIYRDFVSGRSEAFKSYGDGTGRMPAATGIGTRARGISICFLAARNGKPIDLENKRQVPAYRYPKAYGPESPSFARATLLEHAGKSETADEVDETLFVSGTASIIGHETVHRDNVGLQTATVLDNIAELIGSENLASVGRASEFRLDDLRRVKVYVKNEIDAPEVKSVVTARLGVDVDVKYLNVAVCRDDLLVEIEGLIPGSHWDQT